MKEDSVISALLGDRYVNRSLQHRSNMNDLVRRGIQSEEEDWGS